MSAVDRQALALANPLNHAEDTQRIRDLWRVDELPGGDLLRTCLAVDR